MDATLRDEQAVSTTRHAPNLSVAVDVGLFDECVHKVGIGGAERSRAEVADDLGDLGFSTFAYGLGDKIAM